MSYLSKIEYRIEPTESFLVVWNCSGCGAKSHYLNTKRFRVNANGSKIDVWLIYQCEKCKHTCNLTVYERENPKRIPKEEYQAFLENDERLAEVYGMNALFFAKNKAEIDREAIRYHYVDKNGREVLGEGIGEGIVQKVLIRNPYNLRIRPEKQVAELLGISRSRVKKMLDEGRIITEQTGEGLEVKQV